MKLFHALVFIMVVSTAFASRGVQTCKGSDSVSTGMDIYMADCPADGEEVAVYYCGQGNQPRTWMDCELIETDALTDQDKSVQARLTENCDQDDYENGVFALVTLGGDHSDQLCIMAVKHEDQKQHTFCNLLPSSAYNSVYNSKGMCEDSEWTDLAEFGRLVFGVDTHNTMGYAYFMRKSQETDEALLIDILVDPIDYYAGYDPEYITTFDIPIEDDASTWY